MLHEDSYRWIASASLHRDTRECVCASAARLTTTRFDDAMLLYGVAYCMDIRDGELSSENVYAFGWARYTLSRIMTWYALEET